MNSPFGDTTYTKVFVGGLAWETQSHTLRRHFEQYGDILEAVVISDKNTGRSKGYGFVTFRDPDSARRACVDPNPIIDGRRANCNLASLGRPHPFPPLPPNYGIQGSGVSSFGNMNSPAHRPAYSRSPNPYNQQPIPYAFHHPGFYYPPYGYGTYGSEYVYPQGVYNPYSGGQQYVQVYGMAGNVSPGVSPRGQFAQPIPGYSTLPNYGMPTPGPAHQILQFANRSPTAALPSIQPPPPHSDGGQAQITSLSSNSPHFTSGSDQTPT